MDIRIYLPEKVALSLLRVDKSSCLLKLSSMPVLLYEFLSVMKNLYFHLCTRIVPLKSFSQILTTVFE